MSTFECPVVPIALEPHPNADALSLVRVYAYTVCVRTEDWLGRDRGAYLPVDSLVDTARPEFAFLAERAGADGKARIKALKLRGIISQGLLVPAEGRELGADLAEPLGVAKYEPALQLGSRGEEGPAPRGVLVPEYTDVEPLRRYVDLFVPGEEVVVTEKLHGANARYAFADGADGEAVLFAGSHKRWIRPGDSVWWRHPAVPRIQTWAEGHRGLVLYGELYGRVQDLKYGLPNGLGFAAFDVFDGVRAEYLDHDAAALLLDGMPTAPVLYRGPFDLERIEALAEQDSAVAPGQLMEGVVVRPVRERWSAEVGRLILKLHSQRYLLRKGA